MKVSVFPVEIDYVVMECRTFVSFFVISVLSKATVTYPATERYRDPASVEVFLGDGPICLLP